MRKFQCLLFVLKRSYICYYIICMTVHFKKLVLISKETEGVLKIAGSDTVIEKIITYLYEIMKVCLVWSLSFT